MRRKKIIIAASYLTALILVLIGFIVTNHVRAEDYKLRLTNTYQHAFSEVVNGVSEMESALQKSLYVSTAPMISVVCTEVYGKSQSAQMALGELPFTNYELEQVSGFISKVGDYVFSLSKNAAMGSVYSDEEYENLQKLTDVTAQLSNNLNQLLSQVNEGWLNVADLNRAISEFGDENTSESKSALLGDSIQELESEFPEIPSLIYDGPFSEHILQMTPKFLEGKEEIDEAQAMEIAADFIGADRSEIKSFGTREGNLPVFILSLSDGDTEVTVEVSRVGGVVVNVRNSRLVSERNVEAEEAVATATQYLADRGYESMKESYWIIEENIQTINFAYEQDGIVIYPDLIKVVVSLDDGQVIGFEGLGYVMSHTEREIPAPSISEEEARQKVSAELNVLAHAMAIIPTDGKYEVFCHEFVCENAEGQHYILYVNAETGAETKLLVLLEDENGTLAM